MPSSRILIASNTLTGTAASVTFSSIPSTYTDLVLKVSARSNTGGSFQNYLRLRINTSSALSSATYLAGSGSAASSFNNSLIGSTGFYPITNAANNKVSNSSGNTASTFDNVEIYIPSYTVTQNKPLGMFGVAENNTTEAYVVAGAGLERSTSAITQLQLLTDGGNFVSGSSFFLYGLKNS